MRVRATKDCFAGGARRRKGGPVFEYDCGEGELPAFLEEVDAPVESPEILEPELPGQAPRSGATPSDDQMSFGPEGAVPPEPSDTEKSFLS